MPLRTLELPAPRSRPPERVASLLLEADRRINAYFDARHGAVPPGFVPSDFARVESALRSLRDSGFAPGNAFCEWGSGFGVATLLAALLGFDAVGIEYHQELVDESDALAADLEIPARFACGTFIPDDCQAITDGASDEAAWLHEGGTDGYAELDADPGDFDVVFAYPWPGQEGTLERLFHRVAEVGAVLVTYRGVEDVVVQQKVPKRPGGGEGRGRRHR